MGNKPIVHCQDYLHQQIHSISLCITPESLQCAVCCVVIARVPGLVISHPCPGSPTALAAVAGVSSAVVLKSGENSIRVRGFYLFVILALLLCEYNRIFHPF